MKKRDYQGLTEAEVAQAVSQGLQNDFKADTGTSTWQIIKRNVFTLFNALNVLIAIALAVVGAWAHLGFFLIIAFNSLTGIMTELRAKRMVDKLNLINQDQVTVIRNYEEVAVSFDKLVLGDVMILRSGDQVPSDARVLEGMAEVNEAMLTGESDLVLKKVKSEILSGSYLVSGHVYAKVIRVGVDNYASKLMTEAKVLKPIQSQIMSSLDKISSFTGKLILPFGLALFMEAYLLKKLPLQHSVVSTATPLLDILPKGIALLTIAALLTAVIKLGMRQVLVQEMYSVETMARVDTLCLDKTGTITEGRMSVKRLINLSNRFSTAELENMLSAYMEATDDNNPTAQAIRSAYDNGSTNYTTGDIIPFSSDRKWGSVAFDGLGSVFLGAPEMLLKSNPSQVTQAQERGARVLVLTYSPQTLDPHQLTLPRDLEVLAILEIVDPIRQGAAETLTYLRDQGIDLKIISGDHPVTVAYIAKEAGFVSYDKTLDCSKVSDEDLVDLAEETAIFGRVSPYQKRLLVKTLKAAGRTTAMTGDGVNDILALREADCSIVMAEGDPAARQIANLVLLNSDFNDVPEILFEGRRVINNIGRIAPIFLVKTLYSFILAILAIASGAFINPDWLMIFPFMPLQITIMDQFVNGLPPFVLTFETNIRPVEKHFLRHSIYLALPPALMIVTGVLVSTLWGRLAGWSSLDMATFNYYILGSVGIFSVVRACLPLNSWWRVGLISYTIVGFYASAYYLKAWLAIGTLTSTTLPIFASLLILFIFIFIWITKKQKYEFI